MVSLKAIDLVSERSNRGFEQDEDELEQDEDEEEDEEEEEMVDIT